MSNLTRESAYRDAFLSAEQELGQVVLKYQQLEMRKQIRVRAVEVLGPCLVVAGEPNTVSAPASIEPIAMSVSQPAEDTAPPTHTVREPDTVSAPALVKPIAVSSLQRAEDIAPSTHSVRKPLPALPQRSARIPAAGVFLQSNEEAERIQRRIDDVLNLGCA